ncbi:hypothetical protein Aasi_0710 [Candidatus Amoebophilus asiaticus 5a2]|uniref:DUF177 domain-containing protein n=1 Tax=Amoebophilus asiaticus (strain 5a2) TaxID=452471 RepID=B3ES95_AMOA5|nr:DUF177 domain-containing protein [Candidatus Amoebophilus asiaticus]ACE06097.1 hypothetical protein Aasi_0710 [Candidatus Amoebophilus asiaticus 5a2]
MIKLHEMVIQVPRTDTGSSQEVYQLDDTFFKLFEGNLLETGKLNVNIKLDKTPRHIQLLFSIQGEIELSCDRTLEPFNYPINIERVVHFKIGDEDKELDMDLYMIERQASSIQVAQHIYDFVNLSIPMKRLHPRFADEEEDID